MLTIDLKFVNKKFIGKEGLDKNDWKMVKKQAQKAFQKLKKSALENGLGFRNLIYNRQLTKSVLALKEEYKEDIQNIVVLGIGGSALGLRALAKALALSSLLPHNQLPKLFVCDNIDPCWLAQIFKLTLSAPSLFFAISKSGTTAETSAQLLYITKQLKKIYKKSWKNHLVIITDPEKGAFRAFAKKHSIRALEIPQDVGGRFSVLSPVGLAPAVFLGINIQKLIDGAKKMDKLIFEHSSTPTALLASLLWHYAKKGKKNLVLMPYSSFLNDFSEWFAQLWAESLGKRYSLAGKEVRAGSTPIRALGATDQHSQLQLWIEGPKDKVIMFLKVKEFSQELKIPLPEAGLEPLSWLSGHSFSELIESEQFATSASLAKNGVPNLTLIIPKLDAYHLGGLFYFFEVLTVLMGKLFNINPFDQPAVELGKKYTSALMGRAGFERFARELKKFTRFSKSLVFKLE